MPSTDATSVNVGVTSICGRFGWTCNGRWSGGQWLPLVRWAMVAAGRDGNGCRWAGWQWLPLVGMAMVAAGRDGNGCRWSEWQRLPLVGMATVAAGRDGNGCRWLG
jgi:hypothetical protein